MIPSPILTHSDDALDRLLLQYNNAQNIKNIIEIYAQKVQELEPIFQALTTRLDIVNSFGQQLDEIGFIVGEVRAGKNDDEYRKALNVRIAINTSEGTTPQLISLYKSLSGSLYVHLIRISGAEMELEGTEFYPTRKLINAVFNDLKFIRSAGTRINRIRSFDPEDVFSFSGQGPEAQGFLDGGFADSVEFALPFAFSQPEGDSNDPSTEGFGYGHADPLLGGEFLGYDE